MDALEDAAVNRIVRLMLDGQLAAINELGEDLRGVAQQRYNERHDAARRAELQAQRANPLHVDPL